MAVNAEMLWGLKLHGGLRVSTAGRVLGVGSSGLLTASLPPVQVHDLTAPLVAALVSGCVEVTLLRHQLNHRGGRGGEVQ